MVRSVASARGMTLIELTMGLLVASLVACVVLLSLSIDGRVHAARMRGHRGEEMAWLALAAVANDLETRDAWSAGTSSDYVTGWVADGTLYRCPAQCHPFAEGVRSMRIVVDAPTDAGRHRQGGAAIAELHLTLVDGRRFSRVLVR